MGRRQIPGSSPKLGRHSTQLSLSLPPFCAHKLSSGQEGEKPGRPFDGRAVKWRSDDGLAETLVCRQGRRCERLSGKLTECDEVAAEEGLPVVLVQQLERQSSAR